MEISMRQPIEDIYLVAPFHYCYFFGTKLQAVSADNVRHIRFWENTWDTEQWVVVSERYRQPVFYQNHNKDRQTDRHTNTQPLVIRQSGTQVECISAATPTQQIAFHRRALYHTTTPPSPKKQDKKGAEDDEEDNFENRLMGNEGKEKEKKNKMTLVQR